MTCKSCAMLHRASEDDLPALAALHRATMGTASAWTTQQFKPWLQARTAAGQRDTLVLRCTAGNLAGFAVIERVLDEGNLLAIAVQPNLQGLGHGRSLLSGALQTLREWRAQRCCLEVRASNAEAIALYLSVGFVESGRRPRYYPALAGREDAVLMTLESLL